MHVVGLFLCILGWSESPLYLLELVATSENHQDKQLQLMKEIKTTEELPSVMESKATWQNLMSVLQPKLGLTWEILSSGAKQIFWLQASLDLLALSACPAGEENHSDQSHLAGISRIGANQEDVNLRHDTGCLTKQFPIPYCLFLRFLTCIFYNGTQSMHTFKSWMPKYWSNSAHSSRNSFIVYNGVILLILALHHPKCS